jgi:hypothetical protein
MEISKRVSPQDSVVTRIGVRWATVGKAVARTAVEAWLATPGPTSPKTKR